MVDEQVSVDDAERLVQKSGITPPLGVHISSVSRRLMVPAYQNSCAPQRGSIWPRWIDLKLAHGGGRTPSRPIRRSLSSNSVGTGGRSYVGSIFRTRLIRRFMRLNGGFCPAFTK